MRNLTSQRAKPRVLGWAILLGAAHLVKESAFFGLAALTAVGGRPRRQDALVPAGFAAVVLLESGFYAAATGDPLFRINAIRTVQTSVMEALMTSEISTASRLSGALESMLLPWGAGFPFFGLGWPAALGGAAMILVKKERALYSPVTWLVATTLLLLFWPITVRPYRPAMMAHPRIFHVALAPMAVLNDAAPNQPYVRVANDRWISLLRSWYGENPPPSFAAGDARLLEEIQIPGRLSWRPLLAGRIAREPPTAVRLYLVEP